MIVNVCTRVDRTFRRAPRTALLAVLLGAAAASSALGCSEPVGDEVSIAESGVISRVDGGTLGSAYAQAGSTYLSVRSIATLRNVGALEDGTLAGLAERVDGIIANLPADGRISVQELLKIEQPGFIETLFPEEKAALPKLWALLETTASAPKGTAPLGALPAVAATDTSTPAGTLTMPSVLNIPELPSALQAAARRVELTYDSDDDDDTITLSDVDAAIGTPDPYTPAEVEQFKKIAEQFRERATSSYVTRAEIPAPFSQAKTLSSISSTVKLRVEDALVLTESRSVWFSNPSYPEGATRVSLEGKLSRKLSVEKAPSEMVVVIHEGTEREAILDGAVDSLDAGIATFEVWSNGQRKSIQRVNFTKEVAASETTTDLSEYADYVLTSNGAPLYKNVVSATEKSVYNAGTSWSAAFSYGAAPVDPPPGAHAGALARVATPTGVTSGRYEVDAGGAGKLRIDVSPTGVVFVTRLATGASTRAKLHSWREGTYHHAQFPDRLRVMLHGTTKHLKVFFDGQSLLLETTLRAADRTG